MSVPTVGKVLPGNKGTWWKRTAFWNETSLVFAK